MPDELSESAPTLTKSTSPNRTCLFFPVCPKSTTSEEKLPGHSLQSGKHAFVAQVFTEITDLNDLGGKRRIVREPFEILNESIVKCQNLSSVHQKGSHQWEGYQEIPVSGFENRYVIVVRVSGAQVSGRPVQRTLKTPPPAFPDPPDHRVVIHTASNKISQTIHGLHIFGF